MKRYLQPLTRPRNRYLMAFDLVGLMLIPPLAMLIRTEDTSIVESFVKGLLVYGVVMICVKMYVFYVSGLYRQFWAYASVHELVKLLIALAVSTLLEIGLFFGVLNPFRILPQTLPRSLPVISALLTGFWISGGRLAIRIAFMLVNRKEASVRQRRVIIAGAGVAGAMTAKELLRNQQTGVDPVGFVDDDRLKQGRDISGIRVYGTLAELPEVVRYMDAQEVIIAMPTVPGKVVRDVVQSCLTAHVPYKTIPAIFDIIRGKARVDQVREVQLEDLLRRGVITTDPSSIVEMLTGSRVLVTGAGGSIGSELCRQIAGFHPAALILLGHGEATIFQIMNELRESPGLNMKIVPVIADIRDRDRIEKAFVRLKPDVVFHAAAHKHVYLMQENIPEAVTNNVLGTRNLIELAERYDVKRFVMISSDKAVNPTSVMGVTKRIAELVVQDVADRSSKAFVTVRFGNVLGSRGSVVPLFKRQIAAGGPVTVTDPDVTRYFMTIPEAVQLVLQAAAMGKGGEVFVLDMGDQIKVIDVARDLIRLSGYTDDEIPIKITGLLPGEKMFEELFHETDQVEATKHAKIKVCRSATPAVSPETPSLESALQTTIAELIDAAQQESIPLVNECFFALVPQYAPTLQVPAQ